MGGGPWLVGRAFLLFSRVGGVTSWEMRAGKRGPFHLSRMSLKQSVGLSREMSVSLRRSCHQEGQLSFWWYQESGEKCLSACCVGTPLGQQREYRADVMGLTDTDLPMRAQRTLSSYLMGFQGSSETCQAGWTFRAGEICQPLPRPLMAQPYRHRVWNPECAALTLQVLKEKRFFGVGTIPFPRNKLLQNLMT